MALELTDDQISLLQEFINDTPSGNIEAMTLVPAEYREFFSPPTKHGELFKAAVNKGRLKGITLGHFDMGSKHWWYVLHGGN